MHLFIDNHEHKRIKHLKKYYNNIGINTTITTLEIGDLIFLDKDNAICFEYKTLPDFIQSITDTRVFNQSVDMYNEFQYHFIIIVNDTGLTVKEYYDIHELNIKQYYGAITKLNTYTTVLYVEDEYDAYYMMYSQMMKCFDDTLIYKRLQMKTPNPAQNLLLNCKGLGEETVKRITRELNLHNFKDLTRLTSNELKQVDGVGDKTAKLIINYIGETTQIT